MTLEYDTAKRMTTLLTIAHFSSVVSIVCTHIYLHVSFSSLHPCRLAMIGACKYARPREYGNNEGSG